MNALTAAPVVSGLMGSVLASFSLSSSASAACTLVAAMPPVGATADVRGGTGRPCLGLLCPMVGRVLGAADWHVDRPRGPQASGVAGRLRLGTSRLCVRASRLGSGPRGFSPCPSGLSASLGRLSACASGSVQPWQRWPHSRPWVVAVKRWSPHWYAGRRAVAAARCCRFGCGGGDRALHRSRSIRPDHEDVVDLPDLARDIDEIKAKATDCAAVQSVPATAAMSQTTLVPCAVGDRRGSAAQYSPASVANPRAVGALLAQYMTRLSEVLGDPVPVMRDACGRSRGCIEHR